MLRKVPAALPNLPSGPIVKPELDIYLWKKVFFVFLSRKWIYHAQDFVFTAIHPWPNWKTQTAPRGLWKDKANHRRYFEWLGKILSIQEKKEWYTISTTSLKDYCGLSLLKSYYSGSMPLAMKAIYPDHQWCEWLFLKPPTGLWEDKSSMRRYFEWLGKLLNVAKLDDWYLVSRDKVFELRGAGLLDKYDGSFPRAVMDAYPEHKWYAWKFISVPQGWWEDSANQKQFLEFVGLQENFTSAKDWYKATDKTFIKHGGHRFLKLVRKSVLTQALVALYPEYDWQQWKSGRGTKVGTKRLKPNQRIFFDWAAQKLNISSKEDWYYVSADQIDKITREASAEVSPDVFRRCRLSASIMEAYPEHKWLEWKFLNVPKSFWGKKENQLRFFDWLGRDQLGLRSMEDWYYVSYDDIAKYGGVRLFGVHKSLADALKFVFPEHPWDLWKFQRWNQPNTADTSTL